mmetsp:Transcript_45519/g.73192  ORF Transcript_45519/g.73192 Transcript_45519/m.73192 type:complete len:167 (-) Transcript_45519:89-589(-)
MRLFDASCCVSTYQKVDFRYRVESKIQGQPCVSDYIHVLENKERSSSHAQEGPEPFVVRHFIHTRCGGMNLVAKNLKEAETIRKNNREKGVPTIWTYDGIDELRAGGVYHARNPYSKENDKPLGQLETILQRQEEVQETTERNKKRNSSSSSSSRKEPSKRSRRNH